MSFNSNHKAYTLFPILFISLLLIVLNVASNPNPIFVSSVDLDTQVVAPLPDSSSITAQMIQPWLNSPIVSLTGRLQVIALDYTDRPGRYIASIVVNEEISPEYYNIDIGDIIYSKSSEIDISPLLNTNSIVARFLDIPDAFLTLTGRVHKNNIRIIPDQRQGIKLFDDSRVHYNSPEYPTALLQEHLEKFSIPQVPSPGKLSLGKTEITGKITVPFDFPPPPKAPVSGERSVLTILSTWDNHPSFSGCSLSQVSGWMWTDTNNIAGLFSTSSRGNYVLNGKLANGISWDVFQYSAGQNMPACSSGSETTWMNTVSSIIEGLHGCNGNICNQYLTRLHIVPSSFDCGGWAGIAFVTPGTSSTTAFSKSCSADVSAHEIGHNCGFAHSGDQSLTYGDYGGTMGYGGVGFRLFNGPKQLSGGWLSESPTAADNRKDLPPQYLKNPVDGCYSLSPRYIDEKNQPCRGSYLVEHNGYFFEYAPQGGYDTVMDTYYPAKSVRVLTWNGNDNSPSTYIGYLTAESSYNGFHLLKTEDTNAVFSIGASPDNTCKDYKITADCSKPFNSPPPPPDVTGTVLAILIPFFLIGGLGVASVVYKRKHDEWPHQALSRKLQVAMGSNADSPSQSLVDNENPTSPRTGGPKSGGIVAGAAFGAGAGAGAKAASRSRPQPPQPKSGSAAGQKSRKPPIRLAPSARSSPSIQAPGPRKPPRAKPSRAAPSRSKPTTKHTAPGKSTSKQRPVTVVQDTRLAPGQMVSVKWSDGKYYSAKVLSMIGPRKAKVRFVEYDEAMTVNLTDIRM